MPKDKSTNYFDNDLAKTELIKMISMRSAEDIHTHTCKNGSVKTRQINHPSDTLIKILTELYSRMLTRSIYYKYPTWVKEEMLSRALYDFLRWGHNYKPAKKPYSYLTACAQNSFRRSLNKYYDAINMDTLITSSVSLYMETLGEVAVPDEYEDDSGI